MFQLRLQQLQSLGGLTIALCCIVLGGMSFLDAWNDDRRVKAGIANFDRFRKVLVAVSAVSAERGPANLAMTVAPDDPAAQDWLRKARATTDSAIDAAADALQGDLPGLQGVTKELKELRARLAEGRAAVDKVAATRPDLRSPGALTRAILAMFVAADIAEQARMHAGLLPVQATPEIGTEVFLGIAASSLREHAGRYGSYVVMQLVPNSTDIDVAFERMFETAGRLLTLRRAVETLTLPMRAEHSGVVRAMAALDARFFQESMPLAAAAARGARADERMSVKTFTGLYVPNLRLADDLREEVAAASRWKLEQIHSRALTKLVASGVLTALVCLIVLGITFILRHALFYPLTTVRRQVIALASGDLSEPKLEGRVGKEVGEMLAELNTLRGDQRLRRELDDAQRAMADELRELAQTDALTGILNRRAIEAEAERMTKLAEDAGESFGLVLFDIDHFKRINHTHGHGTGDIVLRRIARELVQLIGPGMALGRYGGEEFALLLPNTTAAEAAAVAEHFRERIAEMQLDEAPTLAVTASFGVATLAPGSAAAWESLVATADRRLYAAKRAGRNRVCGDDQMPDWRWVAA
ncbi:GGDEF domain-containing protein [Enterovirga rhinocerotis]|uniref:diguanylate cyclase n=1 Tax=Enterovirga rhinocerotis TaxID=1339210 RepID=A0A4R7BWQ8_9HYPH|nr:diguanylate cyclase [Enterovirga rhinocerotis]TDR90358.1 diguanylate cyclase (GGDEF)-like protein [Enterovirga rhinocerotis]